MKSIYKLVGAAGLLAWVASAQAVFVSGGNTVSLSTTNEFGADYRLVINQVAAPNFDGTTLLFKKTDNLGTFKSTLQAVALSTDESADFYSGYGSSYLSPETLAMGQFTPLATRNGLGSVDVNFLGDGYTGEYYFQDYFYLVFVTGSGWNGAEPKRDVFGWAQFHNTPTGLVLTDSAIAYGERAITVGFPQQLSVPEASTVGQMGLGLLALGICLRRRKPNAKSFR